MTTADERETKISRIIDIEMNMFEQVKPLEPSQCMDQLKTFRLMRWMSHSVLPEEILASYLNDLEEAQSQGTNFMTLKYARMSDQIPPLYEDTTIINNLVEIESQWMDEMHTEHPSLFPGTGESFRVYMSSELETLSPRTLELLLDYAVAVQVRGGNLVRDRYQNMVTKLGYDSIEAFQAAQNN